mmetsp:Transcript_85723/g.255535  ORF Transcript_85723/g.255535 Transcript_85723/m.255535 type:complete len:218 (+) Transcript_85723:511-1164(+)
MTSTVLSSAVAEAPSSSKSSAYRPQNSATRETRRSSWLSLFVQHVASTAPKSLGSPATRAPGSRSRAAQARERSTPMPQGCLATRTRRSRPLAAATSRRVPASKSATSLSKRTTRRRSSAGSSASARSSSRGDSRSTQMTVKPSITAASTAQFALPAPMSKTPARRQSPPKSTQSLCRREYSCGKNLALYLGGRTRATPSASSPSGSEGPCASGSSL